MGVSNFLLKEPVIHRNLSIDSIFFQNDFEIMNIFPANYIDHL